MHSSRLQLALNVSDLDRASEFYAKLFDAVPHKTRSGYVNFAIADPPLKLVLFEAPDATGPLNHLGVEMADNDQVEDTARRLEAASLETRVAAEETCCHATQSKVYVDAPDVPLGLWEFYTVLDENPDMASQDGTCCGDDASREACCT